MSALGGIYNFSDAPPNEHVLTALGNALAEHGPDGGREVCSSSVGMAYRAFHTNQESRLEIQPLVSPNKHILAWDGRIDNRSELISMLRDDPDEDRTDAALVLAGYLKWGLDVLPKIIGDFALSLWDPYTRTLLLARDPIGTRPLFYFLDRDRLVWSSDLAPLIDLAGARIEIDDDYIAGYLTTAPDPELTPYTNIRAILPGNVAIVRGGQFHLQRYWSLDPQHEIHYKRDEDYEDHFRQLFREAVGCRLRADKTVWAELSGGLDSSSIVCMADDILGEGGAEAAELETVSYVYDESPTSDERKFIVCVEEKVGKRGHHLREEEYRALAPCDTEFITVPSFLHNFARRHLKLCALMREKGSRVLLTGQGGDHLLWSCVEDSPELADLLVQFKLFRLHRRLRSWAQARRRSYLDLLWKGAVLPGLPRRARATCSGNREMPPWYDPEFAARMKFRERLLSPPDCFGYRLPSRKAQSSMFLRAVSFVSAGFYRDWGCIEVAYPYLHRPLVEFLQAIPFDQLLRPGETRSLHRRALRSLLPEKIARRKGKRGPDEALYRALIREWPRLSKLFANASICARGYADPRSLQEALNRGRYGQERFSGLLMRTITLELWLRSLEERSSRFKNATLCKQPSDRQVQVMSVASAH